MAGKGDVAPGQPVLEVRELQKRFGEREVLRGVTLEAERAETVAIIGPSGGGKSTLLRCINGLERPDAGLVRVAGEVIGAREAGSSGLRLLKESEMAAQRVKIGMVFQHFNLFSHWSVLKNVAYGPRVVRRLPRRESEELAMTLLRRVGLGDRANAFPRELSGGQAQRVAIARALAMAPSVLLFDEPTSALDPANVGEVLGVMRELSRSDTTLVIVTHEIAFAREVADSVVYMEDGRVLECGPARAVLSEPSRPETARFLAQVL